LFFKKSFIGFSKKYTEEIRKKDFLRVCEVATKYREVMHPLREIAWGPVAIDGEAVGELLGAIALNQRGWSSRGQAADGNTGDEAHGDYQSGMESKSGDRVYQNIDFRLKGTVYNLIGAARDRQQRMELQVIRLDDDIDPNTNLQISSEISGIHRSLQALTTKPVIQYIEKIKGKWYGQTSLGRASGSTNCSLLFEVNEEGVASTYNYQSSTYFESCYDELQQGFPLRGNNLRRYLWSRMIEEDRVWSKSQNYPSLDELLNRVEEIGLDWRLPEGRYIRMADNIDLPHGTTFDFILRKEDGHPNITSCPPQKLNRYLRNGMVFIHHHHDAIGRVAIAVMKIPPGCPHVSKFVLRKRAEAPQETTSVELDGGNATITTTNEHGLSPGDWIVFDAYDHDEIAHLSGSYQVNSCPDSNTIEFSYGIGDNYVLNDIDDIRIRRLSADSQLNIRLFPDNVRGRYNDGEDSENWSFAEMGVQLVAYAVQKKDGFKIEYWDEGNENSPTTREDRLLSNPSIERMLLGIRGQSDMAPIIPPVPKSISGLHRLDDRDKLLKFAFDSLCKYRLGLKSLAKKYQIAENIGYGLALEILTLLAFGIRGTRSAARGLDAFEDTGGASEIKSATGNKGDNIGTKHPTGNYQLRDNVTETQRKRRLYINRSYEFREKRWFGRTRGNLKIALLAASQDNMAQMHTHMVEKFRENPSSNKFQYQAEPFDSNIARKAWGLNHVLELTRVVELIEYPGWFKRRLKRLDEIEPLNPCNCQICQQGTLEWSSTCRQTRVLQINGNDISNIFPIPAPPLPESTKMIREEDRIKVSTEAPHGLQRGQWVQIYRSSGAKGKWRDYYGKYQILDEGFEDTSFLLQPRATLVNNEAQSGSRIRLLNDEALVM
tara:strand:- start:187 stop:2844 length:2658 start_codon:yes stop_codon:yes gene_type:complete